MELGPDKVEEIEKEFEKRFICVKCKNKGGYSKRIAVTGDGLSKLIDVKLNRMIKVSCTRCGYTEFFDLTTMKDPEFNMDIINEIYG
jgi:predicted nucleic-acid-binding Zn-ribbon protein